MEIVVSRKYLAGKAFSRDTYETFCYARLYYLIHTFCAHTIYTHITDKWWRGLLRENPCKNTWELEIVIPTILYTFVYGISLSPTSPFPYHWEVDSINTYHTFWECHLRENPSKSTWELVIIIPTILYTFVCGISLSPNSPFPYHWEVNSTNTYHTFWECQVRFLVLLGSIGRSKGWQMQHRACCGIRGAKKRHGSEKPCWSRSLEGLGTEGRLSLEGFLLTHVS